VQSKEVDAAVSLQVVLQQKVLIFVLNEIFRVFRPGLEVYLGQEPVCHQLQDLPCPILPGLVALNFRARDRRFKHMNVLICSDCNLRLKVFKLHW
jgi:hypothetical protein